MIILILFLGFQEITSINRGPECGVDSRVICGDFDRDGMNEIAFYEYRSGEYIPRILFLEFNQDTLYVDTTLEDSINPGLWYIGDLDLDGLYDLISTVYIGSTEVGFSIFESPDSFSLPLNEVWRETTNVGVVSKIDVYDVNGNGFPEIYAPKKAGGVKTGVYEYNGTSYELLGFLPDTSGGVHTFGDFNSNGYIELINTYENFGAWVVVLEYDSVNYNEIERIPINTINTVDCISDDWDTLTLRPEFLVKGYVPAEGRVDVYIFRVTGIDVYRIIREFHFYGDITIDYWGGYSATGDVDGDGTPEIVLESCLNVYIIKSTGKDTYRIIDTLPGNWSGSSIAVHDIDFDGINEIIISGGNLQTKESWTKIYKWDGTNISENLKVKSKNKKVRIQNIVGADFKLRDLKNYEIFNISGQKLPSLDGRGWGRVSKKGIYFIKTKNKIFKIIKIK